MSLIESTISGNRAMRNGGGVYIQSRLDFVNTIIAGNDRDDCLLGCPGDYRGLGTIGTNSSNLVGDASVPSDLSGDPRLDVLADNGGFTLTHALLSGSPAIDAVAAISCTITTDQRGEPRPVERESGSTPGDIGAFELQGE